MSINPDHYNHSYPHNTTFETFRTSDVDTEANTQPLDPLEEANTNTPYPSPRKPIVRANACVGLKRQSSENTDSSPIDPRKKA